MYNHVNLIGHVGMDPAIRQWPNGKDYATFTLATNRGYKNSDGKWTNYTSWHNIAVKASGLMTYVEKHIHSGCLVHVEGVIEYFTKDDKVFTNISVLPYFGTVQLLRAKSSSHASYDEESEQTPLDKDKIPF